MASEENEIFSENHLFENDLFWWNSIGHLTMGFIVLTGIVSEINYEIIKIIIKFSFQIIIKIIKFM